MNTTPEAFIPLDHALSTLSYRTAKTLRDMPEEAIHFRPFESARSPIEILAHMSDLLDWALSMVNGSPAWAPIPPTADWNAEVTRFFTALELLHQRLRAPEPIAADTQRLFQGPIADALTHTGQLAMLRRMAGAPIKPENFYKAEIANCKIGL